MLLVALPVVCSAAPAMRGETGVIMTPNTETAPEATVEVSGHAFDMDNLLGITNFDVSSTSWAANVGITDSLEATVGLRNLDYAAIVGLIPAELEENQFYMNLKYQVLREPEDSFGLAGGILDVWGALDSIPHPALDTGEMGLYIVASKNFSDLEAGDPPMRVNVGILFSEAPLFADDIANAVGFNPALYGAPLWLTVDDTKFFGSAELGLTDEIMVLAELAGESFNYGVRVTPTEGLALDAGIVEAYGGSEFFWGGSYGWSW